MKDNTEISKCTRFVTVDLVTNEIIHCEPALFMRESENLCGPNGRFYSENKGASFPENT